jgi:hypothetical protein
MPYTGYRIQFFCLMYIFPLLGVNDLKMNYIAIYLAKFRGDAKIYNYGGK